MHSFMLFCIKDYNPVCGTDGVTYENACSLNREACLTDQNITVLYNKGCQEGQEGQDGQEAPKCTLACTKVGVSHTLKHLIHLILYLNRAGHFPTFSSNFVHG